VAEDARAADAACVDVWAAIDARMDEVYAAHYRYDAPAQTAQGVAGAWRCESAAALYTLDALNALWARRPPVAVAGNAIGAFAARLSTGHAVLHADAKPQAVAMIALAKSSWAASGAVDAASALPLYLRDKVALTTVERAEVKAAKLAAAELAMLPQPASPAAETSKIAP
jgi:tRNA threonylcarbamoyladenosine biosynthesis protein TsaB